MNVTAFASPSVSVNLYSNEGFVEIAATLASVPLTHLTNLRPFAEAVAVIVIVSSVTFVPVYPTVPSNSVVERLFKVTTTEFASH